MELLGFKFPWEGVGLWRLGGLPLDVTRGPVLLKLHVWWVFTVAMTSDSVLSIAALIGSRVEDHGANCSHGCGKINEWLPMVP